MDVIGVGVGVAGLLWLVFSRSATTTNGASTGESQVKLHRLFQFKASHTLGQPEHQNEFEKRGLDYFRAFIFPASGPKGFATIGFDKQFVSMLRNGATSGDKWLVGASTGALRALALISSLTTKTDIADALKEHYCEMYYKPGDTPQVLRPMMEELYTLCTPDTHAIINCHQLRLAIFVAQVNPWVEVYLNIFGHNWGLGFMLILTAALNTLHPSLVGLFARRICFYTGPEPPRFLANGLGGRKGTTFVKLTQSNLRQVLHATTCIPFVQETCTHIPGYGNGVFFDGAFTDYTLNCDISDPNFASLVLSDATHVDKLRQTVFDNYVFWRTSPSHFYRNCSVVCPTEEFVSMLPDMRLPMISDWFRQEYIADPDRRRSNWRSAFELSISEWPSKL